MAVFALRYNASALRGDNIVQIAVDDTNAIIALADSSITATIVQCEGNLARGILINVNKLSESLGEIPADY